VDFCGGRFAQSVIIKAPSSPKIRACPSPSLPGGASGSQWIERWSGEGLRCFDDLAVSRRVSLAGAAVVLPLRKPTRTGDFHGDVGRRRIYPSVRPSVRPSVLSTKKGFRLRCELHTCGTESPRRPSVRPPASIISPSTFVHPLGYIWPARWRDGCGERDVSSCSLRNDREDQHFAPRVFLSFSADDL